MLVLLTVIFVGLIFILGGSISRFTERVGFYTMQLNGQVDSLDALIERLGLSNVETQGPKHETACTHIPRLPGRWHPRAALRVGERLSTSRSGVCRCVSRNLPLSTGMSISWHPFETAKISEITFRALLSESGPGQIVLART
jgi:hypothetical protein